MKCFCWAFRGLVRVVREEQNMRIHLCFAFYVVIAGIVTELDPSEWCAALAFCGLVLGLECLNTALERLCDKVSPEWDARIGFAKDAAAAGVLAAAVCAAVGGCILFFSEGRPRLALEFAKEKPAAAVIIVLTLPLWIYCIVRRSEKR